MKVALKNMLNMADADKGADQVAKLANIDYPLKTNLSILKIAI